MISPLYISKIGDKYSFVPNRANSVISVVHFWFGAVVLKSLLSILGATFPTSPLVGTIFLNPYHAFQMQGLHQSLNCFMVSLISTVMQFHCDTAISIPPLVFMVNSRDVFLNGGVFIRLLHLFYIVIIGAPRHFCQFQQCCQFIFLP